MTAKVAVHTTLVTTITAPITRVTTITAPITRATTTINRPMVVNRPTHSSSKKQ